MQSDCKEIYKLTAKRTGKSEDLYKDVGNSVFTELYNMFRKPNSLITKLKGIGFWFLRRKRLYGAVERFPANYEKTAEDYGTEFSFVRNENKKEIHELFKERLKDYHEYVEMKRQIRIERNKTQKLINPPDES